MLPSHDSSRPTTASSSRHVSNGNSVSSSNMSIKAWFQPRLLDTTMQLLHYQPVEPARVLANRFYNEYVLLTATDALASHKKTDKPKKTKDASVAVTTARGAGPTSHPPTSRTNGIDESQEWGKTITDTLIPYGVEALSSYFMPQPSQQASNKVRNMLATIIALLHQQGRHYIHGKAALRKEPLQFFHVTPLCHEAVDELPLALMVRYMIALIDQELRNIAPRMTDKLTLIILLTMLRALSLQQSSTSQLDDWSEEGEELVGGPKSETDPFSSRLSLLSSSHMESLSASLGRAIWHHLPLKASSDTAASRMRTDCTATSGKASSNASKASSRMRRSPSKPSSATGGEPTSSGIANSSQDELCDKLKTEIEDLVKSSAVMVGQDMELVNITVSALVAEQMLCVVSVMLSAVAQVGVPMVGLLTFHSPAVWTRALQLRCTRWFIDGLVESDGVEEGDPNSTNRVSHTDIPFRKLLRDLALIVKSVTAPSGEAAGPTAESCTCSSLANLLEKRLSATTESDAAEKRVESVTNLSSEVLLWVAELVEVSVYAIYGHGKLK
ncbi:unnamed protein product [Phytomonas sp. EM1]|nr:unnamed protein product [Phytomonas sp. EM1]|eukprot:CCW60424.1 unnamed protein product [Phytomonas sp. isolate EM1]